MSFFEKFKSKKNRNKENKIPSIKPTVNKDNDAYVYAPVTPEYFVKEVPALDEVDEDADYEQILGAIAAVIQGDQNLVLEPEEVCDETPHVIFERIEHSENLQPSVDSELEEIESEVGVNIENKEENREF